MKKRTKHYTVSDGFNSLPLDSQVVEFGGSIPPMSTKHWFVFKWVNNTRTHSLRASLNNLTLIRCPWNNEVTAEFTYKVEVYDESKRCYCLVPLITARE